MLRPIFVCTVTVWASYRDERLAYVEISFHLCSHPQQIVCKGAARNPERGSQRVQCTPLPSRALFVAAVHHLRQRQPSLPTAPAGLLWQLTTCFSLSLNAAHKTTQLHVFYLGKPIFKVFYCSQPDHINTPSPSWRGVCTAHYADGSPSSATLQGNSWRFIWMVDPEGTLFFIMWLLLSWQNRCTVLLITGFYKVRKQSRSRVDLTGFLPWKNAELHFNSS